MKTFNITMIGPSGSGKTAYLGGLYHTFGRRPQDGFSIKACCNSHIDDLLKHEDDPLKKKLWIRGEFDRLKFHNFKYPKGTDNTTVWTFDLRHNEESMAKFSWIDYRGGDFTDLFDINAKANKNRDLLFDQIVCSDALAVFIDSVLLSYYELDRADEFAHLTNIINFINDFEEEVAIQMPIVIVLAKSDSAILKTLNVDRSALIAKAKQAMSPILNKRNKKAFVCVGAVGYEASKDTYTEKNKTLPIEVDPHIEPPIAPFNCQIPLFYTIQKLAQAGANVSQQKVAHLRSRKEYLTSRFEDAPMLERIIHGITHLRTLGEDKKQAEIDFDREHAELIRLETIVNDLMKPLRQEVHEA